MMNRIRVCYFGPIKAGFTADDGFLSLPKVSVLLGNQGTGKSSLAKLISVMSWLEKQLYQGKLTIEYVTQHQRFINQYCAYHGLKQYFTTKTVIHYLGAAYEILFQDGTLTINAQSNSYIVPKIMYIPSERNFASVLETKHLRTLKTLPPALMDFLSELEQAQETAHKGIQLPIGNVQFKFDSLNKVANIIGEDYKLRVSEAASGYQSFIPLFLVSYYLANGVQRDAQNASNHLSLADKQRLQAEVKQILSDNSLSEAVKQAALEELSAKYQNECFLNIVEEIEQNLFPSSQQILLYKLLEFANKTEGNRLILTTHSPYIVNYLALAIKAACLLSMSPPAQIEQRLNELIPLSSAISEQDAVVYELTEQGEIRLLPTYDGLPTDDNFLNQSLAECNVLFDQLLELESLCA